MRWWAYRTYQSRGLFWIARDATPATPWPGLRLQYAANRAGGLSRGTPVEVTATNRRERMTQQYRIEKDSLGEFKVPKDAWYGIQTARAVHNFPISGRGPDRDFVLAHVRIKRAAAVANHRAGWLDEKLCNAIVATCDKLLGGEYLDQFVVDRFQAGAGTSHNMNSNEVIANLANVALGGERGVYKPINPNDHVNMGQSTNDTIPTAIRLAALAKLPRLTKAVHTMADEYARIGAEEIATVKSGRTHLQDAVPTTIGRAPPAPARPPQRRSHSSRRRPRRADAIDHRHPARLLRDTRFDARDHTHRERHAPARLRPAHRQRRNSAAGGTARLAHQTRQGQTGDVRNAEPSVFPSPRTGQRHRAHDASRTAGAQRDDAGDGLGPVRRHGLAHQWHQRRHRIQFARAQGRTRALQGIPAHQLWARHSPQHRDRLSRRGGHRQGIGKARDARARHRRGA